MRIFQQKASPISPKRKFQFCHFLAYACLYLDCERLLGGLTIVGIYYGCGVALVGKKHNAQDCADWHFSGSELTRQFFQPRVDRNHGVIDGLAGRIGNATASRNRSADLRSGMFVTKAGKRAGPEAGAPAAGFMALMRVQCWNSKLPMNRKAII